MTQTTRLAPQRRPGLQTFRGVWRGAMILLATLLLTLTAQTAWAQYDKYMLNIDPNYEGCGSGFSIPVEYDPANDNYSYTIISSNFETEFNRGDGYYIVGWSTRTDKVIEYEPNATIVLKTNPTTVYAIWGVTLGSFKYIITSENPYNVELAGYVGDGLAGKLTIPSSVTIGNHNYTVTSIGENVFYGRMYLTAVTIPSSVVQIKDYAFNACTGLTSLEIGYGVESLNKEAFSFCTGLTEVTIPSTVNYFGEGTFRGCNRLKTVNIYATSMTSYDNWPFEDNHVQRKIRVFSDYVFTYRDAWSTYTSAIEPITVTANDAGGELGHWCTYYNGLADATMPDGTTVYKAALNGAKTGVELIETGSQTVKRGEAVLLKSSESSIALSSATDGGSGDYSGNELQGVDYETAQDANTTYYVLSKKDSNGLGFYKLARKKSNDDPINLGANKAYLAVANSTNAPEFIGFGDGTQTGIGHTEITEITEKAGAWYTLSGVRLNAKPTQKGVYIHNGKEVVIK